MATRYIDSNGIRLHVTTAGPRNGDPVLLLHGFPETSYEWRHQIPALAEAGYKVIAPDTRGFGKSDKPRGRYSRKLLADDMLGVLDHFDIEQAAVVGHDWGGIIGFKLVIDNPDRVSRTALMDTLCTVWLPQAIHGFWFKARPLPEQFFAAYHKQFIEQIFTRCVGPAAAGHTAVPRGSLGSRSRRIAGPQTRMCAPTNARSATPTRTAAAISYYRHGLPFHRMVPDKRRRGGLRFERLSAPDVGKIWRAGLDAHPHGRGAHGIRSRRPRQAVPRSRPLDVRRPDEPVQAWRRTKRERLLRPVPDVLPRPARGTRARLRPLLP